jgi:hypothetical protein
MGLPWVRFDVNMPSHDKILALLSDPSPKRHQAINLYSFSIMWSGGHGTDGRIPRAALSVLHGSEACAKLLVKHRLWSEETAAWRIVNFDQRQELDVIAEAKAAARTASGRKAACKRHHGADCQCWRVGGSDA